MSHQRSVDGMQPCAGVAVPPGARPLVMLAAAAPLNPDGVDVILALPVVCDAYAALQSPHQCNRARTFVIDSMQ
jgi:hypothetical protein